MRQVVTNGSRKFLSCRGKIRTFPAPHGERPLVVPKLPRAPPTDHTRPSEASRTRLRAGRQAGDHRHTEPAMGPGINSSALLRGTKTAQPASSHTDSDNRAVTLTRCGSAGADPDPEQLRKTSCRKILLQVRLLAPGEQPPQKSAEGRDEARLLAPGEQPADKERILLQAWLLLPVKLLSNSDKFQKYFSNRYTPLDTPFIFSGEYSRKDIPHYAIFKR